MNKCASRGPRPRRARSALTRVGSGMAVVAAVALPATACSDRPSSAASGGSSNGAVSAISASAVRYSTCMRTHGVPQYPDPNGSGQLPKITPGNEAQLGVSYARFQAAQTACQRLWPYQGPTQAQVRQELTASLTFARCMRSAGVPNWPDPTTDPESGRVEFVITATSGIDLNSSRLLAKARQCEHGLPAYMLPSSPTGVQVTTSP